MRTVVLILAFILFEKESSEEQRSFSFLDFCTVIGNRMQRMKEVNAVRDSRKKCLFPEKKKMIPLGFQ